MEKASLDLSVLQRALVNYSGRIYELISPEMSRNQARNMWDDAKMLYCLSASINDRDFDFEREFCNLGREEISMVLSALDNAEQDMPDSNTSAWYEIFEEMRDARAVC